MRTLGVRLAILAFLLSNGLLYGVEAAALPMTSLSWRAVSPSEAWVSFGVRGFKLNQSSGSSLLLKGSIVDQTDKVIAKWSASGLFDSKSTLGGVLKGGCIPDLLGVRARLDEWSKLPQVKPIVGDVTLQGAGSKWSLDVSMSKAAKFEQTVVVWVYAFSAAVIPVCGSEVFQAGGSLHLLLKDLRWILMLCRSTRLGVF
jgi:hypothetical protein